MGTPLHAFKHRGDNKLYRIQVSLHCACVGLSRNARFIRCNLFQTWRFFFTSQYPFHQFSFEILVCDFQTPQCPLVRPAAHDELAIDTYPLGTNAVVAVISYTVSPERVTQERLVGLDTTEILLFFFLPYGHLDFESTVTAQNDESKGSFHNSYSRLLNVKLSQETQCLASILSNAFVKWICRNISCALGKWSLPSR